MTRQEIGGALAQIGVIEVELRRLREVFFQAEQERYMNCPDCWQQPGEVWVQTGLETEARMTCPRCHGNMFVEREGALSTIPPPKGERLAVEE